MSCVMQEISQVETLDCSVVKLSTTPRKPTTSRCGGGGGACAGAGAGAGAGISSATSSVAGLASSSSWAPAAAACCLSLIPKPPKPMCHRTLCRYGASQAHVNQSTRALG
nr:hypothetical protein [Tanacetum cinerariifolium]